MFAKLFACALLVLKFVHCSVDLDINLEPLGNKLIYYHETPSSWFNAFQFCASHNLQLLTINSPLENFYVGEFLKPLNLMIWTSGTDLAEEGTWIWMSTGMPFNVTYFYSPQPDNTQLDCVTENCLTVGYKKTERCLYWNDHLCSFKYPFICENKS